MGDSPTKGQEWWRGAVIYQIYPRSFLDSNGDGVGDLAGITEKLDYVASLGVEGFWISPFFRSPMDDFGYDVSDHCAVDPMFGTLADFDRLIGKAHRLKLKVIIDQVYSHTSSEHPWFEESRQSRDNPKADWYVWADPRDDGTPPNNWLSVFGGPTWTWDARRRQYYMHNYLVSQPDLNVHNPAVQDALLEVARFWLERGVDGLRLDAINYAMHDQALRDNPPFPPEIRDDSRPWLMQRQQYTTNHPDVPRFLERIRATVDDYGEILTIAEVGGFEPRPVMQSYTEGGRRLHTAYGFEFLGPGRPDVDFIRSVMDAWPNRFDAGWPTWAFSNHDVPRIASRHQLDIDLAHRAKLFALLLMSLRGNAFVYLGEELGLPHAEIPFEELRDPEAIVNWPHTLGRDGARTPMPWDRSAPNCGFTSGTPWLRIDPQHIALNVREQEDDPGSPLNFFRRVIRLRRNSPALKAGDIRFLDAPDGVLAFSRHADGDAAFCVFNLAPAAVAWQPPDADSLTVDAAVGSNDAGRPPATLRGYGGYIAS